MLTSTLNFSNVLLFLLFIYFTISYFISIIFRNDLHFFCFKAKMVTEGGTPSSHTLRNTPTWAVATVCFVFIFLGLFIEHLFHIASHVRLHSIFLNSCIDRQLYSISNVEHLFSLQIRFS